MSGLEALKELAARYKARGYREPELLSTFIEELSDKEQCNFYFGGFDGGNRCQRKLGHPVNDEEGHEWKANGTLTR